MLFAFSSFFQFNSVQSLSRVWFFATPWITARQASLSITNSRSSLKLTSIESVIPQLFVKPPQITTLPSCFSFSLRWFCLLPPVQYYRPLSIVLQARCFLGLIPWFCSLPPLHIHRGFKSYLAGLLVSPDFFSFKPEFCYEKLMIWATVSSCFCWLYSLSIFDYKSESKSHSVEQFYFLYWPFGDVYV